MNLKFDKFEEQIFLNTVLIENLTDGECGTGFLIAKPFTDETVKIFLFSNKHVFWGKKDKNKKGITKNIRLTLHKLNEDDSYTLGQVHVITGSLTREEKNGYFEHPDELIDIGCANISNHFNGGLKFNMRNLNVDDFLSFSREDLYAGMQVVFIGYPSGYYDQKNFLPVMRSGTIASIPVVNFNGESRILLDAQVFPGSSGSPVFVSLGGKYRLLGIISDAIHKRIDFIEIENTTEGQEKKIYPIEWLGLGLLFTGDMIKEVYNLAK